MYAKVLQGTIKPKGKRKWHYDCQLPLVTGDTGITAMRYAYTSRHFGSKFEVTERKLTLLYVLPRLESVPRTVGARFHLTCQSPRFRVLRCGNFMIRSNPTVLIRVQPYKSM